MALERVQENVHVTVDMKETCVMSVLNCTLKSKMKILNSNVQVSVKQVLLNLQAILLLVEHTLVVWNSEKGMSPVTKKIGWWWVHVSTAMRLVMKLTVAISTEFVCETLLKTWHCPGFSKSSGENCRLHDLVAMATQRNICTFLWWA